MELAFAWYSSQTSFGQIYTPYCRIEIQKRNENWLKRELKIDSGADMTLMERHDLAALGYNLSDCDEIDFKNINNEEFPTSMRRFNIRIGEFLINGVPIAFSDRPIKNAVLGRAKVFDSIDIFFDRRMKHTIFSSL